MPTINKKITLFIIGFLVIVLLFWSIYQSLFEKSSTSTNQPSQADFYNIQGDTVPTSTTLSLDTPLPSPPSEPTLYRSTLVTFTELVPQLSQTFTLQPTQHQNLWISQDQSTTLVHDTQNSQLILTRSLPPSSPGFYVDQNFIVTKATQKIKEIFPNFSTTPKTEAIVYVDSSPEPNPTNATQASYVIVSLYQSFDNNLFLTSPNLHHSLQVWMNSDLEITKLILNPLLDTPTKTNEKFKPLDPDYIKQQILNKNLDLVILDPVVPGTNSAEINEISLENSEIVYLPISSQEFVPYYLFTGTATTHSGQTFKVQGIFPAVSN